MVDGYKLVSEGGNVVDISDEEGGDSNIAESKVGDFSVAVEAILPEERIINPKTGTFLIPVETEGLPANFEFNGVQFSSSKEGHLTVISFGKAREAALKKTLKNDPILAAELNQDVQDMDWEDVTLRPEMYHLVKDMDKVTAPSKALKQKLKDDRRREDALKQLQVEGQRLENGMVVTPVHKESIIQMVDLPAMEKLYELLREKGIDLGEVPPAHITLFTAGDDEKGIAVNSEKDLEDMGTPIDLVDFS